MPRESTLGGRDGTTIDVRKHASNYFGAMSISLMIAAAESVSSRGITGKSYPKDIPQVWRDSEAASAIIVTAPSPRVRGEG